MVSFKFLLLVHVNKCLPACVHVYRTGAWCFAETRRGLWIVLSIVSLRVDPGTEPESSEGASRALNH